MEIVRMNIKHFMSAQTGEMTNDFIASGRNNENEFYLEWIEKSAVTFRGNWDGQNSQRSTKHHREKGVRVAHKTKEKGV